MRGWLIGIGIAAAVLVATWGLLILLARRLPEGTAKELARFLPAGPGNRRLIERLLGSPRPEPDVP